MVWLIIFLVVSSAYLYWRYIWFFRNPKVLVPSGDNVVSPAEGTVVYVKRLQPNQPAISIKKDTVISINDIAKEDLEKPRILIGIFMSPFNVHYNRSPISGKIVSIIHHPPSPINMSMWHMHLRSMIKKHPLYEKSMHIMSNERKIIKIYGELKDKPISCYVIQIAGKTVSSLKTYVNPGQRISKGDIIGMICIGSQVDLIIEWIENIEILVKPGDKVKAGETIIIK